MENQKNESELNFELLENIAKDVVELFFKIIGEHENKMNYAIDMMQTTSESMFKLISVMEKLCDSIAVSDDNKEISDKNAMIENSKHHKRKNVDCKKETLSKSKILN